MAADGSSVARLADEAHGLTDVDQIPLLERGRVDHVCVPVLPPLPEAAEHDEVAVEARVVRALDDRPGDGRRQGCAAAGGDVEALVDAAAIARRAELADRAACPVGPANRVEVAV